MVASFSDPDAVSLRLYDSDLREMRDSLYKCEYGPCVYADFSSDEVFCVTIEDRYVEQPDGYLVFYVP